jgi:hypothetical protein
MERPVVRTQATFALIALLASSAATADDMFATLNGANRSPAAILYFDVPLAKRGHHREAPVFGLRVQQVSAAPLTLVGPRMEWQAKTLIDVPLRTRQDDPLRDSHAAMVLGKGAVIGIIAGAIVAVAVIADDDSGSGGGY